LPSRIATDGDNARYNGYCAALATHWANLRMSDMDFVYDKQTSRLDGIAHWRATKEQSLYRDGAGLKAVKCRLEGRPFRLDDAPDESGLEDPLGHLR